MKRRQFWFPAVLVVVVLCSCLVYWLSYRYDNKYTAARAPAHNGVMRIDGQMLEESPVLFLIDGWEFYQYRLLTPEELTAGEAAPDAYLFIGQYGGFELGDPDASPHGDATYRLTVFTDGVPRDYALELPEIFSSYRIWINGELKHSEGFGDGGAYAPRTSNAMLTFRAQDRIEIVVAVTDHSHFYSGITYPPAFGAPDAVYRQIVVRALVHGIGAAAALLVALFCLVYGVVRRFRGNIQFLGLLCLCSIAYSSYPLVHTLGLGGELWYSLELLGYYSMFWVLIWLQGRICGLPRGVYLPAVGIGAAVSVLMALSQYIPVQRAADLYRISALVSAYMWLSAGYLLAVSVWALLRGRMYAGPLLCGICIFGAALVFDRLFPWFEPILFGWHTETAGLVLVAIVAGILVWDTVQMYRESRNLREREMLDARQIDMLKERAQLQQDFVEQAHLQLHEYKNRLLVMRMKLRDGEYRALEAYLEEQMQSGAEIRDEVWCDHELCNLICGAAAARAKRSGVRLEIEAQVPAELPVEDRDFASLVMNLVDNAFEACGQAPPENRWIALEIRCRGGAFALNCRNSHGGVEEKDGVYLSTKADAQNHGYGLKVVESVVDKYGGVLEVRHDEAVFHVYVGFNFGQQKEPS